jgi:hypothetical protein
MIYKGSCHCGKVSFAVDGELGPVLECNCSHCSRKGYLLWFVPREKLTLKSPESELGTYTFNKHVIQHHFCRTCGCAPFGFGTNPAGESTAAVNARCLEVVEVAGLQRVAYDGRSK